MIGLALGGGLIKCKLRAARLGVSLLDVIIVLDGLNKRYYMS